MNQALSFQDIIKNSVLTLQNSIDISVLQILLILTITLLISLFIIYIYRATFDGIVYSSSFSTSLVLLSLVTAIIIMTISSNIVLSLGMVGALSIVRFRAAIKDPRDIVFQFWSISVGISCGAALYPIAFTGSLFIGVVLIILSRKKYSITTYLLIVKYQNNCKDSVMEIVNKLNYVVKSKTCSSGYIEETYELKKVGKNTTFVETLCEIDGVKNATLIKYDGDYAE